MNIIVTGASQGIGFEMVREMASDPTHKIMAISRNHDSLVNLQNLCRKKYNSEIFICGADLTDEDDLKRIGTEVAKNLKKVDILVNNAGLLVNKPFNELEENDFDRMFSVNVKSIFLMTKMMLAYFNRPAHVVNIGSMGGYQGSAKFPGLSLYSSSKGAVAILTECLAEELKDMDIRVNCLALGSAQTEMLAKAFPGYQAPVSAGEMASFISEFSLTGYKYFNGKVIPVALSTP